MVFGRLTWSGVDLFFVLSGFLIGGILLDARNATNYFKVFYTRRFFRILPIYAAILIAFPAILFVAHRVHHGDFTWLTAGALPQYSYWTFTQNFWMARSASLGANSLGITWSLAIEEQFYLTLPLIVRFFSGRKLFVLIVTGICFAPVARTVIHLLWPHNWVAGFALMPCRADALLLGVLVAMLLRDDSWRARIQRNNTFFAISFTILLLGIAFLTLKSPGLDAPIMKTLGHTLLALFYACLLLYAVTRPDAVVSRALRLKWLGWLGGIAYCTYLLHQFVLGILFGYLWGHEPHVTGSSSVLTVLLALFLTLLLARLSWSSFEGPLIRFGHRSSYYFEGQVSREISQSAPEPAHS